MLPFVFIVDSPEVPGLAPQLCSTSSRLPSSSMHSEVGGVAVRLKWVAVMVQCICIERLHDEFVVINLWTCVILGRLLPRVQTCK